MPYKKAKYKHLKRAPPGDFIAPLKTVDISHTKARRDYPAGTKAVVGKRKKTKRWGIQSVLIPIDIIDVAYELKKMKGGDKLTKKKSTKKKTSTKKWGKIGPPKSAKRKAHMAKIRAKRK